MAKNDKKNNISVTVPGEEITPAVEKVEVKVEVKEDPVVKPGLLISTVDYPTTVHYNGDKIRMTGRAQEKINDIDKVEKCPKEVKVKPI